MSYSADMRPLLQVFEGFTRQLLLVQLPIELGQLGYPEAIAVLGQDLL